MDLFETHILAASIDDAAHNVVKLVMAADAIRSEIDYVTKQMCSDTNIGRVDLEDVTLKLLARLADYKIAIRLGERYCGLKRIDGAQPN